MSIKSDVYDWIASMTEGTTFSIVDCPNHSKQTKTQEWAGIRSAEDYGLCVRTGLTVPVRYTVACEYMRVRRCTPRARGAARPSPPPTSS